VEKRDLLGRQDRLVLLGNKALQVLPATLVYLELLEGLVQLDSLDSQARLVALDSLVYRAFRV